MAEREQVDIAIVGAGMAGLTLALALRETGLQCCLIDPAPEPERIGLGAAFDSRVSALTPASVAIFKRLGAWNDMWAQRVAAYDRMSVWDRDGTGQVNFDAASMGAPELGHIVENQVTLAALHAAVQACDHVVWKRAALTRIMEGESGWTVELADAARIQPRLLVGADGARSRVRQQLGFRERRWPYQQTALVATVATQQSHANTARQAFLETGPLAFLPLRAATHEQNSRVSSIVWSVDDDVATELHALTRADFETALAHAFESRLGAVELLSDVHRFPLVQCHATHYTLPHAVLIGDAAHSIHPLAGQGINLGLLDAAVLAEEIERAHSRTVAIDHFTVLRRYQRRRQSHNLTTMATMEAFARLYRRDALPAVSVVRNVGMRLFNRHTLVKDWVARQAMGQQGDLPRLAQPGLAVDF